MRRRLRVLVHSGCLTLLLPLTAFAQTRPAAPAGPTELAAGQRIFDAQCAWCHGNRGDGGAGPNLHGKLLHANAAFLQLAQVENEAHARGEIIDRWIGKSSVDFAVLLTNLRQHKSLKLFSSVVRSEHGPVIARDRLAAAPADARSMAIDLIQ